MKPSKPSTTAVCALHYAKLLIRLAIFITLLVLYVLHHVRGGDNLKNVTAGANPMDLKRGIDKAVAEIVKSIKEQSQEVGGDIQKIRQVATISANNDSAICDIIAEAMEKMTKDGVITIENAKGIDTTVKVVENAGLEGSVVVNEVKNGVGVKDANRTVHGTDYGYNARSEQYENLFQSGVIDPAKERESSDLSPRGLGSMLLTEF